MYVIYIMISFTNVRPHLRTKARKSQGSYQISFMIERKNTYCQRCCGVYWTKPNPTYRVQKSVIYVWRGSTELYSQSLIS